MVWCECFRSFCVVSILCCGSCLYWLSCGFVVWIGLLCCFDCLLCGLVVVAAFYFGVLDLCAFCAGVVWIAFCFRAACFLFVCCFDAVLCWVRR